MGRYIREKTSNQVPGSGILPPLNSRRVSLYIIVFIALLVLVPLVQAIEPDWNYSTSDVDIGSVAISPDGSIIAIAAEKVLFFSRDGSLLGKEPYGTTLMMSADGKYTVSVYSTTLYFFKNPVPNGPANQQKATKVWERELTEQVYSLDMSRDGGMIVGQTTGRGIFIINTRTQTVEGNNSRIISIIKISPDGRRIVGISKSEVQSYTLTGRLTHSDDLTTFSAPHTVLLPFNGTFAVFNDGQVVRCVNSYNGTELWKGQVRGYVNTLSMTPDMSAVIAGTDNGNIERLDGQGNHVWKYESDQNNHQVTGITCSAVADNGEITVVGTADGKVLFLNSQGQLAGSYTAKERIRHIAISGDGTTVVATGTSTVFAFFVPPALPAATVFPFQVTTVAAPEKLPGPDTGTVSAPITGVSVTTAVIPSATRSPSSLVILASALLLALVVPARKR